MQDFIELEILIDIRKALTSPLTLKKKFQVPKQKVSSLPCPREEL
jgi:hypothetical protein